MVNREVLCFPPLFSCNDVWDFKWQVCIWCILNNKNAFWTFWIELLVVDDDVAREHKITYWETTSDFAGTWFLFLLLSSFTHSKVMVGGAWLSIFHPSHQTDVIRDGRPFQSSNKWSDFDYRLFHSCFLSTSNVLWLKGANESMHTNTQNTRHRSVIKRLRLFLVWPKAGCSTMKLAFCWCFWSCWSYSKH